MSPHALKQDNRLKLSYQDYVLFPDDGKRHEIIDGEHYMSPSPRIMHQEVSRNLTVIIGAYLKKNQVGTIFCAPCDVVLSNWDIVVPDLVFVSMENEKIITSKNIRGVPDLIMEIISPGNKKYDLVLKKNLYERFGVKEYWIIDPEKETVSVYTLSESDQTGYAQTGHRFLKPEIYHKDMVVASPLLSDLKINLNEVFSFLRNG